MIYKGFRVNIHSTKAKEKTTMTKTYAENKANLLARDHNAFKKMKNEAACRDYRTALDNLIFVAARKGIEISYETDDKGFITIC